MLREVGGVEAAAAPGGFPRLICHKTDLKRRGENGLVRGVPENVVDLRAVGGGADVTFTDTGADIQTWSENSSGDNGTR